MATNRARRSYATQHPADIEVPDDPALAETLGVGNKWATPEGRAEAKQQKGESDRAYQQRERQRVNQWRRSQGLAPLK